MATIPSHAEITLVLQKLNPNTAPGPDGLTSAFYKAAWETVDSELLDSIHYCFVTGFLPKSVNTTILSLIPKMPCSLSTYLLLQHYLQDHLQVAS